MSREVDERIVKMEFDNRNFESNVKTSMSTLDKLKQKLNLSDAGKGFDEVNNAAKRVDISPVGKAVDEIKVKFSALQIIGATALANLTNSAMAAGKKLAAAVTDPLVEGGKRRAQNIEQAKFQLEGLGVAWNSIKDDINYGVKDTAYGLDAAAKVASQLVASNVQVGDSMKTALRAVSGVAAMTSSEYEDIGHIFTTVAGQGKVTAMQLNQIAGRGLNAAAALATHLHKSEAEIRKMVSKGKIDFATFAAAMDSAFGAHAKEANKTFSGAMSNVRAALSRIGADVATPYFENLRNIFNALIPVIDKLHTKLAPLINTINGVMTDVSNGIIARINKFSDSIDGGNGWSKLTSRLSEAGLSVESFQNTLIETAKQHGIAIDDMIKQSGSLENTLKNGWLNSDILSEALVNFSHSSEAAKGELIDFHKIVDQVINGDFGNGSKRVKMLTEQGYDYAKVQSLVNDTIWGNVVDYEKLNEEQLRSMGASEEQIKLLQDLAEEAKNTGTPINELIEDLKKPDLLAMGFEAVGNAIRGIAQILNIVKNAWAEVFKGVGTSILTTVVTALYNFSQKLILTDENADKLSRTLKGLFSILDLLRMIAGGTLRFVFELLSAVLGAFNLNILDVTAYIGDAITAFRNWFKEHDVLSNALQTIANVIKVVIVTVKDLITTFLSFPEVQHIISALKGGLINVFTTLSKYFTLFGNALHSFIENIKSAKTFKEFCEKIVESFSGLGVFFKKIIGYLGSFGQILQGLWGNIVNITSSFGQGIQSIFAKLFGYFKTGLSGIFGFLGEIKNTVLTFIKSIDLGALVGALFGGSLIVSLITINKFIKMLEGPLAAIKGLIGSATGVLDELADTIASYRTKIKSEAFLNIAKAIGILAAALVILSQMDQDKVWSAVGALTVLSGVLFGLTIAFEKIGNIGEAGKATVGILALAAGLLMLSISLKKISEISIDKLITGLLGISALLFAMAGAVRLMGNTSGTARSALVILSFAVSIRILAGALKQLDEINPSGKSIALLITIMGMLTALMFAAKFAGKAATQGGIGLLAIAVALGILTSTLTRLNNVRFNSNAIESLVIIMGTFAGLMLITRIAGQNAIKAGVGLIAISIAVGLMGKVISGLNDLQVSPNAISSLKTISLVFAALMAATRLAGKNALKAGASILMISVAIGILSGAIALLSLIDPDGLKRATTAVSFLEFFFGVLIAVTKLASDCKGTLITLTVAVGVLAGAVAVLAMINPEGLMRATAAISILIGMFSLLVASTHLAQKATSTIITLLGVVAGLAAILWALSALNVNSVLTNSAGLSLMLLSMAASLKILSTIKNFDNSVIGSLALLGLVVAEIGAILGIMSALNVEGSIQTATAISILLATMSGVLAVLSVIPNKVSASAIGALALLGLVVAELAAILGLMDYFNVEASIETATSLSILLATMSGVLILLTAVGAGGPAAFIGIGALAALVTAMGAVLAGLGALVTYVPQAEQFLEAGVPVLNLIGNAIGSFIGNIAGGFIDAVGSVLPKLGTYLSEFITNLSGFTQGAKGLDAASMEGFKTLAEAILILTASNVLDGLTAWFTGGVSFSKFGEGIVELGKALAEFSVETAGINGESIANAANAAKTLTEFAASVPSQHDLNSVLGFIIGDNSLTTFAKGLTDFGKAFKGYSEDMDKISPESIEKIKSTTDAAKLLTEFAETIPNSHGIFTIAGQIFGDNSLTTFAAGIASFGVAFKGYTEKMDTISEDSLKKIETTTKAATKLTEFAGTIPTSHGLLSVAGQIFGDNSLLNFAIGIASFGKAFKSYADDIGDISEDSVKKIEITTKVARSLAKFASEIPSENSFVGKIFVGDNSLTNFAEQLTKFVPKFKEYYEALSETKWDEKVIENSGKAITALSNLAGNIPTQNAGIKWLFEGDNSLLSFAEGLGKFAPALKKYYKALSGMTWDEKIVDTSSKAILAMAEFAGKVPTQNAGFKWLFEGDNSLTSFADGLGKFATSFKDYYGEISKIEWSDGKIKTSFEAIGILVEAAAKIPPTGGLTWVIEGDKIGDFIRDLGELAPAISQYATDIDPITKEQLDKIEASAKSAMSLVEFMNSVADIKTSAFVKKGKGQNTVTQTVKTLGGVEQLIELIPRMGEVIGQYATAINVEGFNVDAINSSAQALNAIANVATAVGGIEPGEISDNLTTFMEKLPGIGKGINAYAGELGEGFDGAKVEASAHAAQAICDFAKSIPDFGGLTVLNTGTGALTAFVEQLPAIGAGMRSYFDSLGEGFDATAVQSSVTAAQGIVDFANNINNITVDEGVLSTMFNLHSFISYMPKIGKAINEYAKSIPDVNPETVTASTNAAKTLAEFAKEVTGYNYENVLGTGSFGKASFTETLPKIGAAINEYAKAIPNVNAESVTASANAGKALTSFVKSIPALGNNSSLSAVGNKTLPFINSLPEIGKALNRYSNEIKGIDSSTVEASANAGRALIEFMKLIPQLESSGILGSGGKLASFGVGLSAFADQLKDFYGKLSNVGDDGANIASVTSLIEAIRTSLESAIQTMAPYKDTFRQNGTELMSNLASGIQSKQESINAEITNAVTAAVNVLNSKYAEFKSAGGYVASGFADGINSGAFRAAVAARAMANAAAQAARDALVIKSPSRVFKLIGEQIGAGMVVGIENSRDTAVAASEDMTKQIIAASKKSMDEFESWLNDRKYFKEIGTEQELYAWEQKLSQLQEGTEDFIKAEKEVYRLYNEVYSNEFDKSKQWISDRKYYNELSLEDELAAWERMQERYKWNSEERKEIDKEIYRVKNELTKESFEHSKSWIEQEKKYNRLSAEDELAAWERIRDKFWFDIDIQKEAAEQIYQLTHNIIDNDANSLINYIDNLNKKLEELDVDSDEYKNTLAEIAYATKTLEDVSYNDSMSWRERERAYGRDNLTSEVAADIRMLNKEGRTAEHLEEQRQSEYKNRKALYDAYKKMESDAEAAVKEANDKKIELEQERADKIEEIHKKFNDEIQKLEDEYENQLKSRTDALYGAYKLFDEVTKKDKVKGSSLVKNLQDQTAVFEDWNNIINRLSARGLSSELIKELQEMGPSAIEELKALNSLSDTQLSQYANLWADKHKEASDRAAAELTGLREETDSQIKQLREDEQDELDELKDVYDEKLEDLRTSTIATLDNIETEFKKSAGIIKDDWEEQWNEIVSVTDTLMQKAGWDKFGYQIPEGLAKGVREGIPVLSSAIRDMLFAGQDTTEEVNDSHSPSRVYAKYGTYIVQGLVEGINSQKSLFVDATEGVGEDAIDTMRGVIGRIIEAANSDIEYQPTIRPVVDLSEINSGIDTMNGLFMANRSTSLGMSISSRIQNGNEKLVEEFADRLEASNARMNDKFSTAMDGVRGDIADLIDQVSRLQVVLDGDTLVGAITPRMDKSLGIKATMKRRGSI